MYFSHKRDINEHTLIGYLLLLSTHKGRLSEQILQRRKRRDSKVGSQDQGEPERGLPKVGHLVRIKVQGVKHSSEKSVVRIKPQGHRKKGQWFELDDKVSVKNQSTCGPLARYLLFSKKAGTMALRHHECMPMGMGTDTRNMQFFYSKDSQCSWADSITCEATREQFKIANDEGLSSGLQTDCVRFRENSQGNPHREGRSSRLQ